MRLSVSTKAFEKKPDKNKHEYSGMEFLEADFSISSLHEMIKHGHSFCACLKDRPRWFNFKGEKTYNNFKSTNIVSFDVDDVPFSWSEMIEQIKDIRPTIMYETFNHGIKGNRYRLLYCFKDDITSTDVYHAVYGKIQGLITSTSQLSISDECGSSAVQLMNGTCDNANSKVFYSEPFSLSKFISDDEIERVITDGYSSKPSTNKTVKRYASKSDDEFVDVLSVDENGISYSDGENQQVVTKVQNAIIIKNKEKNTILANCTKVTTNEVSRLVIRDAEEMDIEDFMEKYKHIFPIIDRVERDEWENDKYQFIDDSYFKLCYMTGKLKDGQKRRMKLFTRAILRKVIKPTITPDESFYNLMRDMCRYVDNRQDPIQVSELVYICNQVEKEDAEEIRTNYKGLIEKLQRKNPKCGFIIKKSKYRGKNYNHVKAEVRKEIVLEIYNPLLSIKENLQNIASEGIKISKRTLMYYVNGNGSREAKTSQIEALIDTTVSIRENERRLRELGMKVCRKKITKIYNNKKYVNIEL